MNPFCFVGRHQAEDGQARNQGFEFGRCRRCRHDMLRSRRSWRAVPQGFRVVWKGGARTMAGGAQLLFDLPVSGRALTLVAPRPRRRGAALALASIAARTLLSSTVARLRSWGRDLAAACSRRPAILRLPAPADLRGGAG